LRVHILSHTHWDFEWYEVHEGFKMQLVRLMDHLLAALDADPAFRFHFDGQVMPIMDYLDILRERDALDKGGAAGRAEQRIRSFVEGRQLDIGPCWTSPETCLISNESLIRNINRGIRFARRFGAPSPVFYNADAFQYHSQVPQIIRGTGLTSAFTWRGYAAGRPLKDLTLWQGADGSTVLKYYPARTYAQVWQLPADPGEAMELIKGEADLLKRFAVTRHVLITQGNDQFEPQADVNRAIQRIDSLIGGAYTVRQVRLPDFFRIIAREKPRLHVHRGELTGNQWACTMSGQLSARMYLKQKNKKAEIAIEKFAEPFATVAWLLGEDYPSGLIERAWEYLMRQHFHHCNACAIDEVHREGEVRYNNAIELARDITDHSLQSVGSKIDTQALVREGERALVIVNPSDLERTEVVKVKLEPGESDQTDADWQSEPTPGRSERRSGVGWALRDESGRELPVQRLINDEEGCAFAFHCEALPTFGYKSFALSSSDRVDRAAPPPIADKKSKVLENDLLRVTVRSNGSLTLLDKRNGALFRDLNVIEDTGDRGDTYNYDPLKGDKPITTKGAKGRILLKENGPLLGAFEVQTALTLPQRLTADRKARKKKRLRLPLRFRITLTRNSPRVHITAHIDNRVDDHRLRALFSGVPSDWVYVQTQGDLVKRPILNPVDYPASRDRDITHRTSMGELPREARASATQFQRNFVGLHDGETGLVVLNKGLPEYEAGADGTIALTLLRCIGWLSLEDLTTRKRLAGPKIAVPDAQCKGEHKFKYAILALAGPWRSRKIYEEENRYNIPLQALTIPRQGGQLPPTAPFLRIRPDGLMASAIKKAYEGDDVIVRLFNTTSRSVKGSLEILPGIDRAWLADMNEGKIKRIPVRREGTIALHVGPKKIVTLRFVPKQLPHR
jgi:mannosylglycerate hydrolase